MWWCNLRGDVRGCPKSVRLTFVSVISCVYTLTFWQCFGAKGFSSPAKGTHWCAITGWSRHKVKGKSEVLYFHIQLVWVFVWDRLCEWGCLCVLAEVSAWTQTCSPAWDSPMMKRSPGPSAARIKERLNSITHECRWKPVGVWEGVLSWVISFGEIQWEMIKTRSGGKSLLNTSKIDTNSTTRASRFLQI